MSINVETEKKQYCKTVRIDTGTYSSEYAIEKRSRVIFRTFARVLELEGDSKFEKQQNKPQREAETKNLIQFVKREVLHPILASRDITPWSQPQFDDYHRRVVASLKTKCSMKSKLGLHLTVGMAQKLINLHCKDFWALDLLPSQYSAVFHPPIDQATLNILHEKGRIAWTHLDSYEEYMRIQQGLREEAKRRGTYPMALECQNWNNKSKK